MAADKSTFAPALALLPGALKADVGCLYRVLRTLDDLVDEDDPCAAQRVAAVERWARGEQAHRDEQANTPETRALGSEQAHTPETQALDGKQAHTQETQALGSEQAHTPETRALEDLARRYPLPREALMEFCRGMRHDIARASVEDDEDFTRYCQQAGGSVGIVLASMLGTTRAEGKSKMATLGRAMQVTNILRDIDEDLTHGRLYIAQSAIEQFGFPAPGAREALLRDHIARADALFEAGAGAIPLLHNGRRAMALAASLYREILRQLERDGFGAKPGRATVPIWRMRMLSAKHRFTITPGQ
jgi:phytoene synthase